MSIEILTIRNLAEELAPIPPSPTPEQQRSWKTPAPRRRWESIFCRREITVNAVMPKLWEMVGHGYLKVAGPLPDPLEIGKVVVARPPSVIMDWLKGLFMPLPQRPSITFEEAGEVLGCKDLVDLAIRVQRAGVVVTEDAALGKLMSMNGLMALVETKHRKRVFSRVELLAWLCGVDEQIEALGTRIKVELEREIVRITELRGPARSIAAVKLLKRYVDAAMLAEGVHKMDGAGEMVEEQMGVLSKCAFGRDKGPEILERLLDNQERGVDTGGVTAGS